MTEQYFQKTLLNFLFALFLFGGLAVSVARADDTVRSTDDDRRYTIRDRGDNYKAIINDRGEKVGYGVKRGDSWAYFVDKNTYSIDVDE